MKDSLIFLTMPEKQQKLGNYFRNILSEFSNYLKKI